jgi:hypothetical protein
VSQTKAAYRFFTNRQVDLPALLHPHSAATLTPIAAQPLTTF